MTHRVSTLCVATGLLRVAQPVLVDLEPFLGQGELPLSRIRERHPAGATTREAGREGRAGERPDDHERGPSVGNSLHA
jgi:hypothetical protein